MPNEKKRNDGRTDLMSLLQQSDADDKSVLVDYLTDSGKGRISMSTSTCSSLIAAQARGQYSQKTLSTIESELSRFGGNSIVNLFRGGEGVPYKEIVKDVLEHLKGKAEKDESVESMELKVLQLMAAKAWEQMSEEERKAFQSGLGIKDANGPLALAAILAAIKLGGFASYLVALQIANTMARLLLGRGLTFATNAGITRTVSAAAGPIGWVVAALWTAYDLASPAYRVTVPCVVQIAYMRQKLGLNICTKCGTGNSTESKFCSNCGAPLAHRR